MRHDNQDSLEEIAIQVLRSFLFEFSHQLYRGLYRGKHPNEMHLALSGSFEGRFKAWCTYPTLVTSPFSIYKWTAILLYMIEELHHSFES